MVRSMEYGVHQYSGAEIVPYPSCYVPFSPANTAQVRSRFYLEVELMMSTIHAGFKFV